MSTIQTGTISSNVTARLPHQGQRADLPFASDRTMTQLTLSQLYKYPNLAVPSGAFGANAVGQRLSFHRVQPPLAGLAYSQRWIQG